MISAGEMNPYGQGGYGGGGYDPMMGVPQRPAFEYKPVGGGFNLWGNDGLNINTELTLDSDQTNRLLNHKMSQANWGMAAGVGLNLVDAGAQTVLGYFALDNEKARYNLMGKMDDNRKAVAFEQLSVQREGMNIAKDIRFEAFGVQERMQYASQKLALRLEDIRQRGQTERAELFASSKAFSARRDPFYGAPEMA